MDVLVLTSDLMIVSLATNAAARRHLTAGVVSTVPELLERLQHEPARMVVLDLSAAGLDPPTAVDQLRATAAAPVRVVAFGPHVHEHRLAAARSANCDEVLTRGQFHAQVDELFKSIPPGGAAEWREG
jgi:CheY-like chemotaxis protein